MRWELKPGVSGNGSQTVEPADLLYGYTPLLVPTTIRAAGSENTTCHNTDTVRWTHSPLHEPSSLSSRWSAHVQVGVVVLLGRHRPAHILHAGKFTGGRRSQLSHTHTHTPRACLIKGHHTNIYYTVSTHWSLQSDWPPAHCGHRSHPSLVRPPDPPGSPCQLDPAKDPLHCGLSNRGSHHVLPDPLYHQGDHLIERSRSHDISRYHMTTIPEKIYSTYSPVTPLNVNTRSLAISAQ